MVTRHIVLFVLFVLYVLFSLVLLSVARIRDSVEDRTKKRDFWRKLLQKKKKIVLYYKQKPGFSHRIAPSEQEGLEDE